MVKEGTATDRDGKGGGGDWGTDRDEKEGTVTDRG